MSVLNRNTSPIDMRLTRSLALTVLVALPLSTGLIGCQSSGDIPAAQTSGDPVQDLQRQIDQADESFSGRAYDAALLRYKAIHLASGSKGLVHVATESAAQASTTHAMLEELDDSASWLAKAEETADESSPRAWSRMLLARGVQRWKRGEDTAAYRIFNQLYNFCFLHGLTARAIQAATLASLTTRGQEQLDWSMRAIQAAQTTGNAKWQAPLWSSHAWLLDGRGRHDEALDAFDKARSLTGRVDIGRLGRLQTDWAYAHGLRMVGRLQDARNLLEETNAIAYSIYVRKPSPRAAEYLGRVLWELGEIDAMEGQKGRARERFTGARDKILEAGAEEGAPKLIEKLDQRIKDLDAPEKLRRFEPKR